MALYLLLTLSYLNRPGYVHDTLQNEVQSCRWAEQLKAGEWRDLLSMGFGKTRLYHGNITSYLMFPAFYAIGRSWMLVRVWPIACGLLTLLMTFLFVRRVYGETVAHGTVFLMVIHSPLIIGFKVGFYQVSSMILYSTGCLYLLSRWWDRDRFIYLWGGLFLLSLGLGSRLWFSWVIFGIVVVGLVWSPSIWRKFNLRDWRQRWKFIGTVVSAFLPLAVLLLRNSQRLVNQVLYLSPQGKAGGAPADVLAVLRDMLSGRYFFDYCFHSAGDPSAYAGNGIYPWVVVLAVLWAVFRGVKSVARPEEMFRWLSPPAFTGALVLAAVLSFKCDPHHVFVIYPFPQLLLAMMGADLVAYLRRGRKWFIPIALFFVVLLASELVSLGHYFVRIHTVGGMRRSSMAVYELARWIRQEYGRDPAIPIVSTQEVLENLFFLAPEVPVIRDWYYIMEDDGRKIKPSGTITFIRPGFFTHGDVDPLLVWQRQHGRRFREIAAFHDRDGYAMFNVYQWDREASDPRYNGSIWPSG